MSRLVIEPIGLYWLNSDNPEEDLCAHGTVSVSFDGAEVFRTQESGLSVSTGALYLLRCLEANHLSNVEDHLFPCCAYEMDVEDGKVVNMTGCGNGDGWQIEHGAGEVVLRFYGGPTISVSEGEWRQAVTDFSTKVRSFFFRDAKVPGETDQEWFEIFRAEWADRHAAASSM